MNQAQYFDYLCARSALALAYRRRYLYPRFTRFLRGRVLDVGCGIGDFVSFCAGSVGVDVNPHAVAYCTSRGLDVRQCAAESLPFGPEEFDGVVLDNVLEHLAAPGRLLAEIRRVLRPGATLLVGVPGERGYAADPDHKVHYDEPRLRAVMEGARFAPRHVFHMPLRSGWLSRWLRQYCVYGVFTRP